MCTALQNFFDESDESQVNLAQFCDVGQPSISKWVNGVVPPKRVKQVSSFTGIPRETLRPDIYE